MEWEQEEIWVFVEGNLVHEILEETSEKEIPTLQDLLSNNLIFKAPNLWSYDPKQILVIKFLLLGML